MEDVVAAGGVVPFGVSELAVVANVLVSEAAIQQQASDIGMLGFVGCVELIGMVIHPNLQLLLWVFWRKCGGGRQGLTTLRRAGMVG